MTQTSRWSGIGLVFLVAATTVLLSACLKKSAPVTNPGEFESLESETTQLDQQVQQDPLVESAVETQGSGQKTEPSGSSTSDAGVDDLEKDLGSFKLEEETYGEY